ncbi:MAG: zinc-ribbon domain-containing protein, partial [Candidatus Thermoplasmatota archaeon]|nr:zinc-ribbon domain-containing protein [Candidatus Thermoplasmatota archaeon]
MTEEDILKCPTCGATVEEGATECPRCKHPLSEEDLSPKENVLKCPTCGATVEEGATECPRCKQPLSEEDLSPKENVLKCPTCGATVEEGATECPRCKHPLSEEDLPTDKENMGEMKEEDVVDVESITEDLKTIVGEDEEMEGEKLEGMLQKPKRVVMGKEDDWKSIGDIVPVFGSFLIPIFLVTFVLLEFILVLIDYTSFYPAQALYYLTPLPYLGLSSMFSLTISLMVTFGLFFTTLRAYDFSSRPGLKLDKSMLLISAFFSIIISVSLTIHISYTQFYSGISLTLVFWILAFFVLVTQFELLRKKYSVYPRIKEKKACPNCLALIDLNLGECTECGSEVEVLEKSWMEGEEEGIRRVISGMPDSIRGIWSPPSEKKEAIGEEIEEEEVCPSCGSVIPKDVEVCPECGEELKLYEGFEEEEEVGVEELEEEEAVGVEEELEELEEEVEVGEEIPPPPTEKETLECPVCGAELKEGATECPECGEEIKPYEEEEVEEAPSIRDRLSSSISSLHKKFQKVPKFITNLIS